MNTNSNVNEVQLPFDFINKMKSLLGEEWNAFLESYEKGKYQSLRFNPLKRVGGKLDYNTLFG